MQLKRADSLIPPRHFLPCIDKQERAARSIFQAAWEFRWILSHNLLPVLHAAAGCSDTTAPIC